LGGTQLRFRHVEQKRRSPKEGGYRSLNESVRYG
jgi:hypothetical protein